MTRYRSATHGVDFLRGSMLALTVALAACGGAQTPSQGFEGIEAIRSRAAENPDDPAAWRTLAEAEMFYPGGDAERVRDAIDRAVDLAPSDPVVTFLSMYDHLSHGRYPAALAAGTSAVEQARTSADPLAPYVGEVALAYLRELGSNAPNFDALATPVFERAYSDPQHLGIRSRVYALHALYSVGRRKADQARLERLESDQPCVTSARVAGPFGPHTLLTFDQTLPAEGRGPLAERYDLGPGRGEFPVREVDAFNCSLPLGGGPLRASGGFVVETTIEVSESGSHAFYIASADAFKLSVDGELVDAVDNRRSRPGSLHVLVADLEAGTREVEVKVATRNNGPSLEIYVDRQGAFPGYDPAGAEPPLEPSDPFRAALASIVATLRGDAVTARQRLVPFLRGDVPGPLRELQAYAAGSYPYITEAKAADEQRRLLQLAIEKDPDLIDAAATLAGMESGDVERLARTREAVERFPDAAWLHLSLARLLIASGYPAEAQGHIRRAREILPESCETIGVERGYLAEHGSVPEANALVAEIVRCDQNSGARFDLLLSQRRWEEAEAEAARLAPMSSEARQRRHRMSLATARGDRDAVRALRREREADFPLATAPRLRQADRRLASGDREGAVALLDAALRESPRYMSGLRVPRRLLSQTDWLEGYRLSGREAIDAYEASGEAHSEAGQVLVLDYMVTRVNRDGSATSLVHQVIKVQSEESLERLGQMSLPGRLLTLRTIKPDGRILEPNRIQGLDSIPMPELAISDYIEYEYILEHGARPNGSFVSSGWLFQSFGQPFGLSQLRVIAPRDLELTFDGRGPLPEPVETFDGDDRVLTWTVRDSPQLTDEPMRAGIDEVIPRIRYGSHYTWEYFLTSIRNNLADRDPVDPDAQRLVRRILRQANAQTVEEKARVLYGWVHDNIEPGGPFTVLAPVAVSERAGSPSRVYRYLLALADVPADFAVAASFGGRRQSPLADENHFDGTLVAIRGNEPRFVWLGGGDVPFGYLPVGLRGQEATILRDGLPRVQIPDPGVAPDHSEVDVDVSVAADGSAEVTIVLTSRGESAARMRRAVERATPEQLRDGLEGTFTAQALPGSRLRDVALTGVEDREADVTIRAELTIARLGSVDRGRQVLPLLYPSRLARSLASLPSRRTVMLFPGTSQDVRITVRSESGGVEGPDDADLTGPAGARYIGRTTRSGNALTVVRSWELPRMLVRPEDYPSFASFLRTVDSATEEEISLPR